MRENETREMEMFNVIQISGQTGEPRKHRTVTVTEDRVGAIRYWMYRRICAVPAESSDSISVRPA